MIVCPLKMTPRQRRSPLVAPMLFTAGSSADGSRLEAPKAKQSCPGEHPLREPFPNPHVSRLAAMGISKESLIWGTLSARCLINRLGRVTSTSQARRFRAPA